MIGIPYAEAFVDAGVYGVRCPGCGEAFTDASTKCAMQLYAEHYENIHASDAENERLRARLADHHDDLGLLPGECSICPEEGGE